jgi:hypothetical protein
VKIYQDKGVKNKEKEQYQKYSKVLNELKEIGHFTEEEYSIKMNMLMEYYKV